MVDVPITQSVLVSGGGAEPPPPQALSNASAKTIPIKLNNLLRMIPSLMLFINGLRYLPYSYLISWTNNLFI